MSIRVSVVTLSVLVALGAGCQPSPTNPAASPSPKASRSPLPAASPSAAPSESTGAMVEATTLKLDGKDMTLPRTFESDESSRGVTFTVGNLKSSSVLDVPTLVIGLRATDGKPLSSTTTSAAGGLQNLHWYAKEGTALVAQTYMWDGTPETESVTIAGGKATFTFKGKVKRGTTSVAIEGTVTGIPL